MGRTGEEGLTGRSLMSPLKGMHLPAFWAETNRIVLYKYLYPLERLASGSMCNIQEGYRNWKCMK